MFCIFSQLHRKSLNRAIYQYPTCRINPFQPTVSFHIETSHLICSVNQVTCFNMKCNTWLRWVKIFSWIMFRRLYQKRCWNIVKHVEQCKTRQLHDINSYRKVNTTCKNFVFVIGLFICFKTLSRTACWVAVFLSLRYFCVNSFNAKFCNESMNFLIVFCCSSVWLMSYRVTQTDTAALY